jgi:hypothetical protein
MLLLIVLLQFSLRRFRLPRNGGAVVVDEAAVLVRSEGKEKVLETVKRGKG